MQSTLANERPYVAPRSILRAGAWAVAAAAAVFLLFHNLAYNPRTWHDEGAALSLARTLVEDGYYGVRSSDGYQTFGPVQSVGPTVILPVALAFRVLGVGLVQGRVVAALFALVTLWLFHRVAERLYGRAAATVAVLLLVSSPTVEYLQWGRQALGEVPAFGFFLAGYLLLPLGDTGTGARRGVFAGLLLGAAMVTKSHYLVLLGGTLMLLILLDLLYWRSGIYRRLIVTGAVALACVLAWWGWQRLYYGPALFATNLAKMAALGSNTSGLNLRTAWAGLQSLVGSSGPLYYFWFIPGYLYCVWLASASKASAPRAAFGLLFTLLCLAYYVLLSNPWPHYALAGCALLAIYVGKIATDLARGLDAWRRNVLPALWRSASGAGVLPGEGLLALGTLVAVSTLALLAANQFQSVVRSDVLDTVGLGVQPTRNVPQLQAPHRAAALLAELVADGEVVETWERELAVLTPLTFHYPDQSLLASAHAAAYRDGAGGYALGADYLNEHRPSLVVVGFYARTTGIYDEDYLRAHAEHLASVGQGDWRYDIYRLVERRDGGGTPPGAG